MSSKHKPSNVALPRDAYQEGQAHLANGNYKDAIHHLSQAIFYKNRGQLLDEVVDLYIRRCESYLGLASLFLTREAQSSENAALYGPDPMQLATLALNDIERALEAAYSISCDPGVHANLQYLKGRSLQMLERYSSAEEAYLQGLHADLEHEKITQALHELKKLVGGNVKSESTKSSGPVDSDSRKIERTDELDCVVCSRLLYEPVTTTCGHTFCKSCLERSVDHSQRCPLCRTVLYLCPGSLCVSTTLKAILQKNFEAEYRERAEESAVCFTDQSKILPLFVLDVVLPRQQIALRIFEPRYRLMIRRCMEGSRIFGISGREDDGSLLRETCACEIKEFTPLPDGCYEIVVVGLGIYTIQNAWEQDGYRVARVTSRRDTVVDDESMDTVEDRSSNSMDFTNPVRADKVSECKKLGHEAMALVSKVVNNVSMAIGKEIVNDILERCGIKPAADDFVGISWYVGNFVGCEKCAIRRRFLHEGSVEKRLRVGIDILKVMAESPQVVQNPQCNLM